MAPAGVKLANVSVPPPIVASITATSTVCVATPWLLLAVKVNVRAPTSANGAV